jgi:hypothetical protein
LLGEPKIAIHGAKEPQMESKEQMKLRQGATALYHVVFEKETFEDAAEKLLQLIRSAQEREPGAPRYLFLDIDGHRNKLGGFDSDMAELQTEFMHQFLLQFLTGACTPLGDYSLKDGINQSDDIPAELRFISATS